MEYTTRYASPLGMITLASDGSAITGLWFDGQKYYARTLAARHYTQEVPVLTQAQKWLDIYFTGREPEFMPPVRCIICTTGSTILRGLPASCRIFSVTSP